MNRLCFFMLAVSSACALSCRANETGAEDSTGTSSYQLKNRSSFSAPAVSRPPFWPIGHVKRDRSVPVVVAPVLKIDHSMFAVTSILLGNPSLAVINGRAYGEGEYLRKPKKSDVASQSNSNIRIRVLRIRDGSVTLQTPDGQTVSAPLRRPELGERKPAGNEELLLSDD